jgi:hypothetical protein
MLGIFQLRSNTKVANLVHYGEPFSKTANEFFLVFNPSTSLAPASDGWRMKGFKLLIVLVGRTGIEPVAR